MSGIHKGQVCLSRLPPALKRQAWAFIQSNRPELLALLKGLDPMFNLPALVAAFQATVWVPIEDSGLSRAQLETGA